MSISNGKNPLLVATETHQFHLENLTSKKMESSTRYPLPSEGRGHTWALFKRIHFVWLAAEETQILFVPRAISLKVTLCEVASNNDT